MQKTPLDFLKENDETVFNNLMETRGAAFTEGALSVKTKTLIALGIDTAIGADGGVRVLANQALELGATKEEIMEVVRVVQFITGASGVFTAARVLAEVFEK